MGDSNYVFGAIIDAEFLTDGRIALLDLMKRKVFVYSPEGQYLGCAGSDGPGPGEFTTPYTIASLSNGGFAVTDIQASKVVFFDSELTVEKELIGFQPMAPDRIEGGADGSIIGRRHSYYFNETEGQYYRGNEICVWSDSTTPDFTFLENYLPQPAEDLVYYNFTADYRGNVYCSPSSKTDYEIIAYYPDGDTLFTYVESWVVTMRTPEELAAARPHMVIPGPGSESTSSELSSNWTPDSIRNAAYMVGIDSESRLWVKSGRGETASPVFDLFNTIDGTFLGSIETTLPAIACYWSYEVSEHGIVAWDHNPADYPTVYVMDVVLRDPEIQ